MKTSSKKTNAKEEDSDKETEEKLEELPIEKEEAEEDLEETEKELPIEETETEDELEETEEMVEEAVAEEEIEEPIEEEIIEEEEAEKERPERIEREVEEEIVEERIYTIPLGRAWISPPKKRAPRAIRIIRGFITRHMKIKTDTIEEEAEKLVISNEVNEKIWSRGIKSPPRKIRIRAVKNKEGTVTLHLAEGD